MKIINNITFIFVLSDRNLSNLFLLQFSNGHSHSHPLPLFPALLADPPQCFTILGIKSHFSLILVCIIDPSQHERSPSNSALSTSRVGFVPLYNSSLEGIFPIFSPLRQV